MPITPKSLLNLPRLLLSSTPSNPCFYLTLCSLSHSLISRVAALRFDRGDVEGAARAQALARILGSCGLRLNIYAWNIRRDFMKDVARELAGVAFDLNQLLVAFGELRGARSNTKIIAWAGGVSNSIFTRLLNVFHRSGPLRDIVLSLQKEVVDGDLLRDCIELGSNDLNNLIQCIKDIASVFIPTAAPENEML
ncbi:hypothetical protein SASPL_132663 [Salvia splendens]|uniref:Uncharacterized protein n=1 Tax=Salvia splendens TaxID=180675 RepID=A0A8X8X1D3_SALSN|nr:uncharacterized protein LOC121758155 [Salvia splendens]XP_042009524.1 uncharacterized protein LOC121758155 [Salvia splendens]KAG6405081.1 hypothetical protein SASPL_132663 [Salvia splendens]